jgi:hypothetical protein
VSENFPNNFLYLKARDNKLDRMTNFLNFLGTIDEESLESLCKLLATVGAKLDSQLKDLEDRAYYAKTHPKENIKVPKFLPQDKWMTKTFDQLKTLSENKKLSSRIRFALLVRILGFLSCTYNSLLSLFRQTFFCCVKKLLLV